MRGNARSTAAEASYNNRVRRIVSLPRTILGNISRTIDQGIINLLGGIGIRSRRNNTQHSTPFQNPPPHYGSIIQEEYAFLDSFEQQFGSNKAHPFFYACSYMDALKIAKDEGKFVFLYLHSPEHPFTSSFVNETLCCELVVQFLDVNFVCWAALANRGEGFQLSSSLKASTFPFCALVAPVSEDSIAVLQQIEGPVTPSELMEIMQNALEEEGLAFGNGMSKKAEKRREDSRLREEQDTAYFAALHIDQEKEKEKLRTSTSGQNKPSAGKGNAQITQILVRFPNGERKEHSFLSSDKIQDIFRYIDALNLLPGLEITG